MQHGIKQSHFRRAVGVKTSGYQMTLGNKDSIASNRIMTPNTAVAYAHNPSQSSVPGGSSANLSPFAPKGLLSRVRSFM